MGSYSKLLAQSADSDTSEAEKERMYAGDHLHALQVLVLNKECMHYALEQLFGRPGSEEVMSTTCNGMCPNCTGK